MQVKGMRVREGAGDHKVMNCHKEKKGYFPNERLDSHQLPSPHHAVSDGPFFRWCKINCSKLLVTNPCRRSFHPSIPRSLSLFLSFFLFSLRGRDFVDCGMLHKKPREEKKKQGEVSCQRFSLFVIWLIV